MCFPELRGFSLRGTVDILFTARQLQEKCHRQNRDFVTAFVDLSKGFDIFNREILWGLLERYGCTNKILLVQIMVSRVIMAGGDSSCFEEQLGVKQGCVVVIAPVLFNLYAMGVTMLLPEKRS